MPSYDQVTMFFNVLSRIVIEIFFILFSIGLLAGVLARTFKWSFKKIDREDSTTYQVTGKVRSK